MTLAQEIALMTLAQEIALMCAYARRDGSEITRVCTPDEKAVIDKYQADLNARHGKEIAEFEQSLRTWYENCLKGVVEELPRLVVECS